MRVILALALASSSGAALAQGGGSDAVAYCSELKRVVALAATKERFAAIAGKPRDGDFRETNTCDSNEHDSAGEAERTQAVLAQQIKACLGEGWAIAAERSSANYVVLHDVNRPVSITLSTDETADRKHIVHFTMFVRRN